MKNLILAFILSMSAFASKELELTFFPSSGDHQVSIIGEKAAELYSALDIKAVQTNDFGPNTTMVKNGKNLTCTMTVKTSLNLPFFDDEEYETKLMEWFKCATSLGLASTESIDVICGKKPQKPNIKKYDCRFRVDSKGAAY